MKAKAHLFMTLNYAHRLHRNFVQIAEAIRRTVAGKVEAEWSASRDGDLGDLGSSPTTSADEFSTIEKCQKIIHMLTRSSYQS